jgi:lipopolysaccharide export LptBFGC system permease protein LptF
VGAARLHRYLARLSVRRVALALAVLGAIFGAVDLVEARSLVAAEAGAGPWGSYALRLPAVACHVLPLAATLGALLALGALRRAGEWEALLGAGLGPARLIPGLAVAPLLAAAVMAPLALEFAPRANAAWSRALSARDDGLEERAGRFLSLGDGTVARVAGGAGAWRPVALIRLPDGKHRGMRFEAGADEPGLPDGAWAAAARAAAALGSHEEPASAWSGLAGQTLPRARLAAAIEVRRRAGLDSAGLEAERALRHGLILACALLPLLGLGLAIVFDLARASALAALALALGAGTWLLLALAWNGAATGAWSADWICPGAPAALAAAVLGLMLSRRRGTP